LTVGELSSGDPGPVVGPEVIEVAVIPVGDNGITWKPVLVVPEGVGELEDVILDHVALVTEDNIVAVVSWHSSLIIIVAFGVTVGIFTRVPLERECRHECFEIKFERTGLEMKGVAGGSWGVETKSGICSKFVNCVNAQPIRTATDGKTELEVTAAAVLTMGFGLGTSSKRDGAVSGPKGEERTPEEWKSGCLRIVVGEEGLAGGQVLSSFGE